MSSQAGDITSSGDGDSTFTTLCTPSIQNQLAQLAREPPIAATQSETPSKRKGMFAKMRKPKGCVDIEWTFKNTFGKAEFKGKQREIMESAIKGLDILVIAPTGMGKSLCFQVPAVAEEHGLTIVITPLLSLMANQVQALEKLNIPAAMLTSKTDAFEREAIIKDMRSGHPKNRLLYITPERLATKPFQNVLMTVHRHGELARLVVDEAHCISEWGHDFRKEYQSIGDFRKLFGNVPIMALTASATKTVQKDICLSLDLRMDMLYKVVHSFNRINLFYEVRYMQDNFGKKLADLTLFISNLYRRKAKKADSGHASTSAMSEEETRAVSGIVYCRSRKNCDIVSDALRKKGINAAAFHRGLKDNENDRNAYLWQNAEALAKKGSKRIDCIVATVAFGMGIDAPNVRYVIHWDLPTSFEGYYQETGRAGRDGHASRCVMYYTRQDAAAAKYIGDQTFARRAKKAIPDDFKQSSKSSLEALMEYAENVKQCRHLLICKYFGEKPSTEAKNGYCNRFCDVCKSPEQTAKMKQDLDPKELVATQMPNIQKGVEDEVREAEESMERKAALSRSASTEEVSAGPLPGFSKASTLQQKKRTIIDVDNEEEEEESTRRPANLLKQPVGKKPLFSKSTSEEMEEDIPPEPPTEYLEEEESFALPPPLSKPKEQVWVPMRRPSKQLSTVAEEAEKDDDMPVDDPVPSSRTPSPPPIADSSKDAELQPDAFFDDDADLMIIEPPVRAPSPLKSIAKPAPKYSQVRSVMAGSVQTTTKNASMSGVQVTNKSTNMGSMSVNTVKSGIAGSVNVNNASKSGFSVPFDKKSARANQAVQLDDLDDGFETGADAPNFILFPATWQKKIDIDLRKKAVRQLHYLLSRSLLSTTPDGRNKIDENKIFAKLGSGKSTSDEREAIVLYTALELEGDIFWMSLTSSGFKASVTRYVGGLSALAQTRGWIDAFPESQNTVSKTIFDALQRAVKFSEMHSRQQSAAQPKPQSSDESDDDFF